MKPLRTLANLGGLLKNHCGYCHSERNEESRPARSGQAARGISQVSRFQSEIPRFARNDSEGFGMTGRTGFSACWHEPQSLEAWGLGRFVFRSGLIQRFASRKAFLDSVPISDARFTELPAEINLFPASQAWKVHQPRLEVLDQAPGLLNLFDRLSQLLGSLIALRLFVVELRERRKRTAQHHNA